MKLTLYEVSGRFWNRESKYRVEFPPKSTVGELISHVITQKDNGIIEVKNLLLSHYLIFKNGSIIEDCIPNHIKDSEIRSMSAEGGWGKMDYEVTI